MTDFLQTVTDHMRTAAADFDADLAAAMVILVDDNGHATPLMFASGEEGIDLARGCILSATEHLWEMMQDSPVLSDFEGMVQ
jgi:hypothetical protein